MITKKKPWLVLAVVSTGLFLVGIDMTVLNVALPVLAHELDATTSDKLWMVNAYSLVLAGLLPGFGTLSDRIGHRKMFVAGLVVFGASSSLAAFSPNAEVLIGARGVLAVGAAMMLPATISIVRVVFIRDNERAIAIGIWGSVSAGAVAIGPILGGALLEHFWWGSVFLINVPVVLATLLFTFITIPPLTGNPKRHWDSPTSAVLTIALIALLYALKALLKVEIRWIEAATALIVGVVFFRWFIYRQRRLPSPLIDFPLFRRRQFSIGTVGALVASFVMIGLQYVLSQEMQLVRAFTPLQAGLYLLPIAVGAFVAGPVLGSILFRVGIERMMATATATAALGMALYACLDSQSPLLWQVTTLAMIGIGLGGVMSVSSTSIMISAPDDKAGMAGAIEGISYELGGTLGVAVMGSVIASIYTRAFDPPNDAGLPPSAWDSLDQTLIAVANLRETLAQPVVDAGRAAFLNGVSISLLGGTVLIVALFILTALYVPRKKA